MTGFQKFIKYASIVFGAYLSVVIIGVIVIVIMSIFGIFTGIDYLNKSIEYKNDSYEDRRYEDELGLLKVHFPPSLTAQIAISKSPT